MRIGVDIDDVLFPWYQRAHDACHSAGITNGVTPSTWSPHEEYGCDADAWYAALAVSTINGHLYRGDPIPGAVNGMQRLAAAGHTLHLVTARGFLAHGTNIRHDTVAWLDAHSIPHDTLTFSKSKTVLPVDVFADDSERNIADLVAAGVSCCLIDAPHNQHVNHYWRAASFAAFTDNVLSWSIPNE